SLNGRRTMSKTTGAKAAKTAAKKPVPKALAVAKGSKVLAGGKAVSNAKPKAGKAAPKTGSAKTAAAKIKTTVGAGKAKLAAPNAPARTMASAKPAASKKSEGTKKKMASRVKIAEIVLPARSKPLGGGAVHERHAQGLFPQAAARMER